MKIVVATSGRFHALDLARELSARGHQVLFYSDLLPSRARRFGLPSSCSRTFFPFTWPFVWGARHHWNRAQRERWDHFGTLIRERLLLRRLPPCDVFISMAGLFTQVGRVARQRGARWIIERGSRHVLSQKEILAAVPSTPRLAHGASPVSSFYEARNLIEYEEADLIAVPSRHAAESFVERGHPRERLFVNPYGVDLAMFPPTPPPGGPVPVVLFVGTWSWQKGVDILVEAVRRLSMPVRLIHVGAIAEGPSLPKESWFTHVDPVPQWNLKTWYAQGDLFALASRQEGLALVQAQALACGLPLVCTDRTGGEDLAELLKPVGHQWVRVVPAGDPQPFSQALADIIGRIHSDSPSVPRDRLGSLRGRLGWTAYGERYDRFLRERFSHA